MMPSYRPPRWPTKGFVQARGQRAANALGGNANRVLDDINVRRQRIRLAGNDIAGQAEAYAKNNAPWKDRSGAARAGLQVRFLNFGDTYVLRYAHSVFYGRYLEYRNGGRYAILRPTSQIYTPRLRDRLRRIFRRVIGAFSLRSVIDTSSAFDPKTGTDSTRSGLW